MYFYEKDSEYRCDWLSYVAGNDNVCIWLFADRASKYGLFGMLVCPWRDYLLVVRQ